MAKRIEKIKLNNVEYVISTDNIINVNGGLTNAIAAEVLLHPGRLLRGVSDYPEYIFVPNYQEEARPTYYTAVAGDEKRVVTICINWDDLKIVDSWDVQLGGDPIEIVDLTNL